MVTSADLPSLCFFILSGLICCLVVGWFAYVEIQKDKRRERLAKLTRGNGVKITAPARCPICYKTVRQIFRFCPRCGYALRRPK
jgi:hypothetical protein